MSSESTDSFASELQKFITINGEYPKVTPMQKEASVRRYFHLQYKDCTKVMCLDASFLALPYDFIEVQKFYKENSITVPEILDSDNSIHCILLSDEGKNDLSSIEDDNVYLQRLKEAIDIICTLQKLKPIDLIKKKTFDYKKLATEGYHTINAYAKFQEAYKLEVAVTVELFYLFEEITTSLGSYENKIICHRDFHSRNLMLNPQQTLTVIDFQDTMMGTPAYDLASLLYDAYRPISPSAREELYSYYLDNSPVELVNFREIYLRQALQRSFKALGTYLKLFHQQKMEKYRKSIINALENLLEITQLGCFADQCYVFFYQLNKSLLEDIEFLEPED
ncbi:MAG: phosphotransferase [Leptospiraceae bacterium]|nr:phosphotransferase [Leptospiraceae bacterium]MCP5496218.1 phosphotransferase [Leptospiraceae bacterium]